MIYEDSSCWKLCEILKAMNEACRPVRPLFVYSEPFFRSLLKLKIWSSRLILNQNQINSVVDVVHSWHNYSTYCTYV
jgi:hypothetical protein